MTKSVLVTGGAGFIGSHLCDRLIKDGSYVECIDNFVTGQVSNIESLFGNERFSLRRHDVVEKFDAEPDELFNLACPASPPHYQADPVQTLRTNVLGSWNVLEVARRSGGKVLQASTSEVYGDPAVHPQPESYWGNVNPIGPRACYDEGKRCAESLLFDYHRQHNVPIKVVRIFNTYGPNMHPNDGRVVSNFILNALRGADLPIYGDGSQTRSFCYVDDLVEGIVRMMRSSDDVLGPVNLGNPVEVSIRDLASIVIDLTGSASKLCFLKLPIDDPRMRKPDIRRAQEVLEWHPTIQLREGLERTITYFERELQRV